MQQSFDSFNPTDRQRYLFNTAQNDAQERIKFLRARIDEFEKATVLQPAKNEQGQDLLSGANDFMLRLAQLYREELDVLQVIHTNTK